VADVGLHESLAATADAWLVKRSAWRARRLPAPLRAAFEADTRRARSRAAGTTGLIGGLFAAAFYPTLAAATPGLLVQVQALYLGLALPVVFVTSLLVLLNPRPWLRETLLVVPSLVTPCVLTILFVWGDAAHPQQQLTELYLTGMILVTLFATVTLQLRFAAAVLVAVASFVLFALAVHNAADIAMLFRNGIDLIFLGCAGYMLLANWRIHAEQRDNYVFAARDRWQAAALSVENRALDELARRDPLTGLANRRAYDTWLHTTWLHAREATTQVGLIMVDVDHFKKYNDFYGHPAGDACLRKVALCLREQLRDTTDLVARVGGEEFAVILPGADDEACRLIGLRLRAAVEALGLPHLGQALEARVTISCGCASLAALSATSPDLCAEADAALYLAKEAGRNRVCVARESLVGITTASAAQRARAQ